MRIFVSHSFDDKSFAEGLADRLRVDKHHVFESESSLARSEPYDKPIREEISRCSLFLFLLSPASIETGCYALHELGLAKKRWPNPSGRVLPLMVRPVDARLVPSYLQAVTRSVGDHVTVTEAVQEVHVIGASRWRRRIRNAGGAIGLAAALLVLTFAVLPLVRRGPITQPVGAHEPAPAAARTHQSSSESVLATAAAPGIPAAVRGARVAGRPEAIRRQEDVRPRGRCTAGIETQGGSLYLVCRCSDGEDRVTFSVRTASLSDELTHAKRRGWSCPQD